MRFSTIRDRRRTIASSMPGMAKAISCIIEPSPLSSALSTRSCMPLVGSISCAVSAQRIADSSP